jgi:hypothetical protein
MCKCVRLLDIPLISYQHTPHVYIPLMCTYPLCVHTPYVYIPLMCTYPLCVHTPHVHIPLT